MLGPMIKGREADLSPMLKEFSTRSGSPAVAHRPILARYLDPARRTAHKDFCPDAGLSGAALSRGCRFPAFRHGERSWQVEEKTVKYLDAWSYTEWFNLLGTPAVVVPVGKSPEGLPIGVQIVARPWQEELAISVAAALEDEVGRHGHPPI